MPYIDPSTVEQVKKIDLLTYLQEREPDELVKIGPNAYATKTHDSLKISNGKWYWWSRGFGGRSALDYLIKVRGMSFTDAVSCLAEQDPAPMRAPARKAAPPEQASFRLPPKSGDASRTVAYLESRGIAPSIVAECMDVGLIYENRRGNLSNVVFVGFDNAGVPRCAALRGCKGTFKGEVAGSDKRHTFMLRARGLNPVLHAFESPIDALSYATLMLEQGEDWHEANLLSLDGIPPENAKTGTVPLALIQYLDDNPGTTMVHLRLDGDKPGFAAADRIAKALHDRCDARVMLPHRGKDWNEYLMTKHGLSPSIDGESDDPGPRKSPGKKCAARERG